MVSRIVAVSLLLLTSPLAAGTFLVSSSGDSGPGTLRQGILDANSGACAAPCTIDFGLAAEGFERRRIDLVSPLPPIVANDVSILADATRGDLYIGKRLIDVVGTAAGPGDGLRIEGARGVRIAGLSFIGFTGDGLVADRASRLKVEVCGFERNGRNGVHLADTNGAEVRGSVITSNGHSGIFALRSASLNLYSNAIGTDTFNRDRGAALGNAMNGIHLHDTRGAYVSMNYIHDNRGYAIFVSGDSALTDLEFNDFTHHRGRPIENGGDGTGDQLAPVIESVTVNRGHVRIRGKVMTQPHTVVRLQVYSGGRLIHFSADARGDESGVARFEAYSVIGALESGSVTAIATHLFDATKDIGQTSEFSGAAVPVPDDVTLRVNTAADSGPGSLRDAIEMTNGDEECVATYPCGIEFDVAGPIQPLTPLPALTRTSVWLDGRTGDRTAVIDGSLCSGCNGLEIRTADREANLIVVRGLDIRNFDGNGIFVDAASQRLYALVGDCTITSNRGSGVHVKSGVLGLGAVFDNRLNMRELQGCVIGGNGEHGVTVGEMAAVRITGNRIGTGVSPVVPFANGGSGIYSSGHGDYAGNVIAFNHQHGIEVVRPEATNAVFGGEIHSNGGKAIELSDHTPVQRAPVIESARADGGSTLVTYSFDSPPVEVPFVYVVTIYASSFADRSGHGEGRTAVRSDYVWEPGTYEITIPRNLAGKYLAATATNVDVFSDRAASTTSEFGEAIQVTADLCPTLPPSNVVVSGSTFRWTPVPGATEYRIWLMKLGDQPRIAYLGTAPEANLQVAPGDYDWVVEARFGERCYGTQSAHGLIRVE